MGQEGQTSFDAVRHTGVKKFDVEIARDDKNFYIYVWKTGRRLEGPERLAIPRLQVHSLRAMPFIPAKAKAFLAEIFSE
jgi:hypothetical protein